MSLNFSQQSMSKQEINISFILSFVYVLRMFGIFLVLPVFFLYYEGLFGINNKLLIGLSFGIYGLSQAIFQIPFGILSDKFGRKKIIYIGLILFAIGSFLCAMANNIYFLIFARFIQGSAAVGSVITAQVADLTRSEVRLKAMSIIGASIALTFSLSLVISPLLSYYISLPGIFVLTGVLTILAIIIIYYKIPDSSTNITYDNKLLNIKLLLEALTNKKLWHLDFGIFVLHCIQVILFSVIPFILIKNLNFVRTDHWKVYLPAVVLGTLFMIPLVIYTEKKFKFKQSLLLGIIFIVISDIILLFVDNNILNVFLSLIFYFTALNLLEAVLPSWVSKASVAYYKGTAMGIYNTFMSLGIFSGGLFGGILQKYFNINYVFYFNIILLLIWFLVVCLNENIK